MESSVTWPSRHDNAVLIAVTFVSGMGCGEGGYCGVDSVLPESGTACEAALRFAARDSSKLVPLQREIDVYFDVWSRVVAAEPVLRDRVPQRYRSESGGGGRTVEIVTSNVAMIDAVNRGSLETGVAEFDELVAELREPKLVYSGVFPDQGQTYFALSTKVMFNEEVLQEQLIPTLSSLHEAQARQQDDGEWTWLELSSEEGYKAEIDFRFGWGDCFTGCAFFRDLRAIASPTDVAVYDRGGDPLPPDLALSPDTRPLP